MMDTSWQPSRHWPLGRASADRARLAPLARWLRLIAAGIAVVVGGGWLLVAIAMEVETGNRRHDRAADVVTAPVALVLGAGVYPDGRLSSAAAYRVDAASELYRLGKVRQLLISGDNSSSWYDEVTPMRQRAVAQGVPADAVALDHAGYRTYDSCYRARAIFGVERAIVVTQAYHLPRSIYTCRHLGIDATGLAATQWDGPHWLQTFFREEPAKVVAWLEVHLLHPAPRYLGPATPLGVYRPPAS